MKRIVFIFIMVLLGTVANAQYFPDTAWTRCYGGSLEEEGMYIQQTFDGGYIVIGKGLSTDGDLVNSATGYKTWMMKLDSLGNIEWQRTEPHWGGIFINIKQTSDSGYIYGGLYQATKLDAAGNLVWQDSIATSLVLQTYDGGYAMAYASAITKLDAAYTHLWTKYLGMTEIRSFEQTSDSGFVIGQLWDPGGPGPYSQEYVKTDDTVGYDFFCGASGGSPSAIFGTKPTIDNDFISFGIGNDYTDSWGYLRKGNNTNYWYKETEGRNPFDLVQRADSTFVFCGIDTFDDAIISKTNPQGDEIVTVSYGGSNNYDRFRTIEKTSDGGYIVVGTTNSVDGHIWNNHGGKDLWIMKFVTDTSVYVPPVVQSVNAVSKIDEVKVYPTLSNGVVHVSLPKGYEEASLELFNMVGQTIEVYPTDSGMKRSIDMGGQASGQYILQVKAGNERKSFRITYMP
ncbi:MAG TPA: T9SS type A sorting domain-containing protein [Flavipsychrobacter sp.]|nr:T9SS type A sorting domain-containing protein [Flavipsychrobacter sp.]